MRSYDEIFQIAADRKGGSKEMNAALEGPKIARELAGIGDDRWLSCASKCVFQAGFNWKVVEAMWPGFEEAFDGFDTGRCAMLNDDDFARLVSDTRIVRNGAKIRSVQANAVLINELAKEHGSAAKVFAEWPTEDYAGLLGLLRKRGSRLGGMAGQYFLRSMGKDSFILSRDVTARLIAEGVIEKAATSPKAVAGVQEAFNVWRRQSGRSLTEISRVLAMSTG